jgi:glycerol-3-phosphate dehydrogenase (NAD(P)+)
MLESLSGWLDGRHLVVHVSRGFPALTDTPEARFQPPRLPTVGQVIREHTACRRIGALAGPITATALRRDDPWGGVVGSDFPEVIDAVRLALAGEGSRLYGTSDLVGTELASALVGLLLVVLGFAQGLGMAPAMLGVLSSRGLAEVARIGVAAGARRETFHGLAGFGDVVAAVGGDSRPELALGRALADRSERLERGDAEADLRRVVGSNVEGIEVARRVVDFAQARGVDTPIASVVVAVLAGRMKRDEAVAQLMSRRVDRE